MVIEEASQHQVVAWWASGRTGIAKSSSAPAAIHFTAAPELGGMEGRWTPEDLLLSAIASCYTTTFHSLAEHASFAYTDLEVRVQGKVRKQDSGYAFSEIALSPNLTIACEEEHDQALRLLHRTMELCLISHAVALQQKFEPHIQVRRPVAVG